MLMKVRIGNSQGIRIPKLLLEQAGLKDEVELEVREEPRRPGSLRGRVRIAPDFDVPLPPEIAASFRGEGS
jgi:hypothetical protein